MSVFAEFHAPTTAYPLGTYLDTYPDVILDVERVVPTGESTHYVWVVGEGHRTLLEDIRGDDAPMEVAVVDEFPDRVLVRVEVKSLESPLFGLAESVGATPTSIRGTADGWTITFRFARHADLKTFVAASDAEGLSLDLRDTYEENGVTDGTDYGLTATQRETLLVAFEEGYFEIPRGISLTELAERIGVSEQAVSERLRRGLFGLLTSTAFEDPGEERDGDGSS